MVAVFGTMAADGVRVGLAIPYAASVNADSSMVHRALRRTGGR
jgi:uncharacterized membrane protein